MNEIVQNLHPFTFDQYGEFVFDIIGNSTLLSIKNIIRYWQEEIFINK
jgi:hypothetical protein